jgi:hypothetical protein
MTRKEEVCTRKTISTGCRCCGRRRGVACSELRWGPSRLSGTTENLGSRNLREAKSPLRLQRPANLWTHCGVGMPLFPRTTHSSLSHTFRREELSDTSRLWQHRSHLEHQRKWPSLSPFATSFTFCLIRGQELGNYNLTVSAARDIFESSERGLLFQPSRTGTSVVSC